MSFSMSFYHEFFFLDPKKLKISAGFFFSEKNPTNQPTKQPTNSSLPRGAVRCCLGFLALLAVSAATPTRQRLEKLNLPRPGAESGGKRGVKPPGGKMGKTNPWEMGRVAIWEYFTYMELLIFYIPLKN